MKTYLRSHAWLGWAWIALLAVFAVYANSLHNGFHFDDSHTIIDNPSVRDLSNVPAFFSDATLFSVLPANRTYRPIVSTSLALDYALAHHSYNVVWFHLSTLCWFVILLINLGILYFRAMQSTTLLPEQNALWAVAGAAWFGLHPAMAETVNYVIQRGDLYCTLGCVAALTMWVQWPSLRRTGLYLVPLALALLSKPPSAIFPLLLLFWVFLFEASGSVVQRWRRSLLAIAPSVVVVAGLMLLQSAMTPQSYSPAILSAYGYRMVQPLVWLRYTTALFLPLHLTVDTDLQPSDAMTPAVLLGFAYVALLAAAIWYTMRRKQWYPAAFGLLWFVITQLPTSLYTLSEVENDHRVFFSFCGLILAVIWTLRVLVQRWMKHGQPAWRPRVAVALGLLCLSGYAWGSHIRNQVWRTDTTLWKDDTEKSPHNGRGLMNYGLALMSTGHLADAKAEFEKALLYTPNYPALEINLGVVNGAMGNAAEAEQHFRRGLSLDPQNDEVHAFYGSWLLRQNRRSEAIAQLQEAVRLNPARPMQQGLLATATAQSPNTNPEPTTVEAWINRSLILNKAGLYPQSIEAAQQALKLNPNSAEAWNNIAAGYESLQQWDAAIAAAQHAIALKPDFQLAKNNLAWSLQQKHLAYSAQHKP